MSKPFVKWAGGKHRLADKLIPFMPAEFGERLDRKKYLFKKTFKSIDEAKRAEKNFANYYRRKGYGVWSN